MKPKRPSKPARNTSSEETQPKGKKRIRVHRRHLFLLAGLSLLAAIAAGCLIWARSGDAGRPRTSLGREGPASPGAPPVDAAVVLHLDPRLPETVEEVNKELMAVAELQVKSLPDNPEAWMQMALAQLQLGQGREALDSWRRVVARDERFPNAHLAMGTIQQALGEDEEAIASFRKEIEFHPESDQAYRVLVKLLLRRGEAEEALEIARECVRRFPASDENQFWLGQACNQLGEYEEARRAHEEAIRINPDFTHSLHALASIYAREGEAEKAKACRDRFAKLKPSELEAERNLARKHDDLAEQRSALVKRHVTAGILQMKAGDPRIAEAHWLRAGAIDPEDIATREALASLYQQQSRAGAALQMDEELIHLDPQNPEYQLGRGRVLLRLGRSKEAEQALTKTLDLQPETAEAHLLLAQIELRSGSDLSAAETHAETGVRLSPTPDSLLVLAAVRGERGDLAGARAALKQAVAMAPDNREVRQAYERLLSMD